MPSLDFVLDLSDKLESQKIDYVIVAIQPASTKSKSASTHVFYHVKNKHSAKMAMAALAKVGIEIDKIKNKQ